MCPQLKISEEFFFNGWIELVELHKKKYVSNLKKIIYKKKSTISLFPKIKGIDPKF
jgi:hypothetical protein